MKIVVGQCRRVDHFESFLGVSFSEARYPEEDRNEGANEPIHVQLKYATTLCSKARTEEEELSIDVDDNQTLVPCLPSYI